MANSSPVIDDTPPAWLTKLENQRAETQSKKAQLGHEFGRGAKCMVCLDKCPGLELHFWRKLCRVCKCRKDQHADMEPDDNRMHTWKAHDLLDQKPSKATYLRVNQKTVLLDWVPPNIDNELASDFMNQLDPQAVPISGSGAASKRKQQLQYQVPIHDLEAQSCDQLTDGEIKKMEQYVAQIKRKNVGQGSVVRIASDQISSPILSDVQNDNESSASNLDKIRQLLFDGQTPQHGTVVIDPQLHRVIMAQSIAPILNKVTNFASRIAVKPILAKDQVPHLSNAINGELAKTMQCLNIAVEPLLSYVVYGDVYDAILSKMKDQQIPLQVDPLFGPIAKFRADFKQSPVLRNSVDQFLDHIQTNANLVLPPVANTVKHSPVDNLIPSMHRLDVNATSLKKCRQCAEPLLAGSVAVVAERAGPDAVWHPKCFTCCSCRELLADLVYFYHNGSIYCGRDLAAILRIPRCRACDELIFTKEYTSADGANFHIKHFCCFHCDRPLAGLDYTPDDLNGMPLCLDCYARHFAKSCRKCSQQIGANEQGVSWQDLHWHAPCFRCNRCDKSLIATRFCVKSTLPFCSAQCVRDSGV